MKRVLAGLVVVAILSVAGLSMAGALDGFSAVEPQPPATPTAQPYTGAECQVKKFKSHLRIDVTASEPRVVYGSYYSLGPGASVKGLDKSLDRLEVFKVRVKSADKRVEVPEEIAVAVRTSLGGPFVDGKVAKSIELPINLKNKSGKNQTFLRYAGGPLASGTWKANGCGGLINDGSGISRFSGTFTTIGKLRDGAEACRVAPARPTALSVRAAGLACR